MMFNSFFMGGFECSSHRRPDGRRLDMLAATGHERWARRDYQTLASLGVRTVRDGLRWHLIEADSGRFDWSSLLPMLRAARETGMAVIWDLCHYGWPDDIDIWSPEFVDRFGRYASAAAAAIRHESGRAPLLCPINEMSYFAWAGGDEAQMFPCAMHRGFELKKQLVRAAIRAVDEVRKDHPDARFLFPEPAIHVEAGVGDEEHRRAAEWYRTIQFEALDMLTGQSEPELGGTPEHLDIVGVNFYPENQWYLDGKLIPFGHHAYRPFSAMLTEIHERYGRPMIVAETGAEGSARASWIHYVTAEVQAAIDQGVPVEGICLYPVTDCPGWNNDRLCPVGLLSGPDEHGQRAVYRPLLDELARAPARRIKIRVTA